VVVHENKVLKILFSSQKVLWASVYKYDNNIM